ncbi:PfkB family carbohydrate kinase [Shigella flexneri]
MSAKPRRKIVNSGKAKRVVVSLGSHKERWASIVKCIQAVRPPVKSESTVGAGDSMVGAMTLKLAERLSKRRWLRFA